MIELEFPWGLAVRENNRQTFRKGRRLTKRDGKTPKDRKCAEAIAYLRREGLLGKDEYVEIFRQKVSRMTSTTPYRKGKEALADCAALQVKRPWPLFPEKTAIEVSGRLYPQKGTKPDAGAFSKIVLDSIERIVYPSDYWVTRMTWERVIASTNPRIELRVALREQDQQSDMFTTSP